MEKNGWMLRPGGSGSMTGDRGRFEQYLAVFADVPGRYGIEVIAAEVGAADGSDLGKGGLGVARFVDRAAAYFGFFPVPEPKPGEAGVGLIKHRTYEGGRRPGAGGVGADFDVADLAPAAPGQSRDLHPAFFELVRIGGEGDDGASFEIEAELADLTALYGIGIFGRFFAGH